MYLEASEVSTSSPVYGSRETLEPRLNNEVILELSELVWVVAIFISDQNKIQTSLIPLLPCIMKVVASLN